MAAPQHSSSHEWTEAYAHLEEEGRVWMEVQWGPDYEADGEEYMITVVGAL
jgi:hypothetical protein